MFFLPRIGEKSNTVEIKNTGYIHYFQLKTYTSVIVLYTLTKICILYIHIHIPVGWTVERRFFAK